MQSEATDPETYAIIGAAIEVHSVLGPGLLETVYQQALAIELTARRIPATREAGLRIRYKGQLLPVRYSADFICHGSIIGRALLLNFGADRLEVKRFINLPVTSVPSASSVVPA